MHAKAKNGLKSKQTTPNRNSGMPQCTITKLFERQKLNQKSNADDPVVECPVCNGKVLHRKINYHLDNECGMETPEKSPYFSNESLLPSTQPSRPQLPVRRKLSLSLRKSPRTTTVDIADNGPKEVSSCQNAAHQPKDVGKVTAASETCELQLGLTERKVLIPPETLRLPTPPSKRLKLSKNALDFKNPTTSVAGFLTDTKSTEALRCSNSTSPRLANMPPLGMLGPDLTVTSLLSSPIKGTCPSTSQSTPIKRFKTCNYFEDLKTPEKPVNDRTIAGPFETSSCEKEFNHDESSSHSPLKRQHSSQSLTPRKLRFIEKIPSCFSDIKLKLSPKKINFNLETTPKSGQLCTPTKLPLQYPGQPLNDFIAHYFPSPSSKGISSSQGSDSGTLFYYLNNFLSILKEVLEVPEDLALFTKEDLQFVRQFYLLPDECQELFVRLFARKHHWFRKGKIKYPEIADDIEPVLDQLIEASFLENGDNIQDLKTVLLLLSSASTKNLCKLLNFKVTSKKSEMMQGILAHCSMQNGMFRKFGSTSRLEDIAIKKAKTLSGRCYRLRDEPRRIFVRILMLYSLTDTVEDGMQEDSPAQLTTMLLINMGRFVFPPCRVLRSTQIFRSRDDFLLYSNDFATRTNKKRTWAYCISLLRPCTRYEKAVLLEGQILSAMESKAFAEALDLCNSALDCFNNLITQEHIVSHDLSLPTFLRFFTAGQVFTRCINQRVEVLQKLHDYEGAVVQLHQLLEQELYCQQYRGHWVERLALNLDQHLQQPRESFDVIERALVDPRVTNSHKLALYQRAERIAVAKKNKQTMKSCLKNITEISVTKVPECHIEGKIMPKNIPGYKSVFLSDEISSSGNNIDIIACSVEEFALSHYRKNNYLDGVHGEGSALVSLFGLLFWDIIYCPGIPDAFRSTHQFYPLDLNSREFYENRKVAIDSQIAMLKNSTLEEISDRIGQCWRSHEGQTSLVNWDLYRSFGFAQSLVVCIGSDCLANICERFAKNYRYFRSGVPDLTIWNSETKQWKMVEVKGPGDRLSHKQLLWLDYLQSIGVSVEVCYVKAIGSKKLKKASLPLNNVVNGNENNPIEK